MNMAKTGSVSRQTSTTQAVACIPDIQRQNLHFPITHNAPDINGYSGLALACSHKPNKLFPLKSQSSAKSLLFPTNCSPHVLAQAKKLVDNPFELFVNGRQQQSPHCNQQPPIKSDSWRKDCTRTIILLPH